VLQGLDLSLGERVLGPDICLNGDGVLIGVTNRDERRECGAYSVTMLMSPVACLVGVLRSGTMSVVVVDVV
jgi:hypothetical protein